LAIHRASAALQPIAIDKALFTANQRIAAFPLSPITSTLQKSSLALTTFPGFLRIREFPEPGL
jgi:hypothetical protein